MLLNELDWPTVDALPRETPVVIPVAAVEQHGHHLPLGTDSMLLGEVVRRTRERLAPPVLWLPLQWLGNSHHHLDFAGTLSAAPRVYLDLLDSLVQNLLDHRFQRILLLNGHGGNEVPAKQLLFEVRQRHRHRQDLLLLSATYWNLAPSPVSQVPDLVQSEMAHACEWETSMMLVIRPDLVGDFEGAEVVEPGNPFRPASRAWITPDRSNPGHIGQPRRATKDKGEALLSYFAEAVESMLRRMQAWDGQSWSG